MRDALCQSLLSHSLRADFVFLTGDLGYKALEPLRDALGERFINAGVAEQNMVSVAAGLARESLRPWVYSIAPFVYARPFEQIRNDVCFHRLPVVLVGNGGGYGYGVMGATHHALEDYGVILTLPSMRAYVPAFDQDVKVVIDRLFKVDHPAYLRLGLSEQPKEWIVPPYEPWRRLLTGEGWLIVVTGTLVGGIWGAVAKLEQPARPTLWVLSELPPAGLPDEFLADLDRARGLLVVEEHARQGGMGQIIASLLLEHGQMPRQFVSRTAQGYVSGLYGSQKFHRTESGIDPAAIIQFLCREDA
ncbi:MAG: transketolase [Isosphaeraceae bacterium]